MEAKLTKKEIDAILKRNQIEDNLLPVVHQYCSPQLNIAEYEFIKSHSELLVRHYDGTTDSLHAVSNWRLNLFLVLRGTIQY
jgi:hypothetical protein